MKIFTLVNRLLSNAARSSDAAFAQARANQYGELLTAHDGQQRFALEGSLFVTTTPTLGTGIALGAASVTAVTPTAPSMLIRNTDALGGKDIILKRLKLICTNAGASGTSLDVAVHVDTANRYASGGTAMVAVNAKADASAATLATIYNASTAIGATAATGTTRLIAHSKLRTGIPVIGDVYSLNFGADPTVEMGFLSGTVASLFAHSVVPVIIPPQASALIYLWSMGQTAAPTYEIVIEHVER